MALGARLVLVELPDTQYTRQLHLPMSVVKCYTSCCSNILRKRSPSQDTASYNETQLPMTLKLVSDFDIFVGL